MGGDLAAPHLRVLRSVAVGVAVGVGYATLPGGAARAAAADDIPAAIGIVCALGRTDALDVTTAAIAAKLRVRAATRFAHEIDTCADNAVLEVVVFLAGCRCAARIRIRRIPAAGEDIVDEAAVESLSVALTA